MLRPPVPFQASSVKTAMVIPFAFLCQDPHLPRTSSSPSPVPSLQRQVALKQTSGLLQVFLTTSCSSCNARCNILQTDRHNNFLLKIYQSASLNQKTQSHLKTKKGRKETKLPTLEVTKLHPLHSVQRSQSRWRAAEHTELFQQTPDGTSSNIFSLNWQITIYKKYSFTFI